MPEGRVGKPMISAQLGSLLGKEMCTRVMSPRLVVGASATSRDIASLNMPIVVIL